MINTVRTARARQLAKLPKGAKAPSPRTALWRWAKSKAYLAAADAPVTLHGMRAGFATTAYRNGVPDEKIIGHTCHRDLRTMRRYVHRAKLSHAKSAGMLGL